MSRTLTETVQIFSLMTGIAVIVSIVNRLMLVPILVIVVLFCIAQKIYMATVQQIKRLETAGKYIQKLLKCAPGITNNDDLQQRVLYFRTSTRPSTD